MTQASRGYLLGAALVLVPVLLCGGLVAATVFGPPERWEIPDGYRGWVALTIENPDCPPLPRRGWTWVIVVGQDGRACTSSGPVRGFHDITYVYVAADGRRTPLPYEDKAYPGVQVWHAGIGGGNQLPYQIDHAFVGTREEAERANLSDVLR